MNVVFQRHQLNVCFLFLFKAQTKTLSSSSGPISRCYYYILIATNIPLIYTYDYYIYLTVLEPTGEWRVPEPPVPRNGMTNHNSRWQCYVSLFTRFFFHFLQRSITLQRFIVNSPSNCTYYCVKLKGTKFFLIFIWRFIKWGVRTEKLSIIVILDAFPSVCIARGCGGNSRTTIDESINFPAD